MSNTKVFDRLLESAKVGEVIGRPDEHFELSNSAERSTFRVVAGVDLENGRRVYVKSIPEDIPEGSREKFELKLLNEAAALSYLGGLGGAPKLVAVGHFDSEFYLVIEKIPNSAIFTTFEGGPEVLLPLMHSGAVALGEVHSANVLHRDMHPGNLLIAGKNARVIDFDCAKLDGFLDLESYLGVMIGIEDYRAPERRSGLVSLRSDVYSLGTVYYRVVKKLPQDEVGRNIRKILDKATKPRPEERYQDCLEMATDIQLVIDGKNLD